MLLTSLLVMCSFSHSRAN